MTTVLVDDAILGQILRGAPHPLPPDATVFTTGCWYVRLCQAVLRGDEARGRLSRPFAEHPPALRRRALDAALDLPVSIGLLSLREIGPSMGRIQRDEALNLLGTEALAAAQHLGAAVHLSTPNPRLQGALERHDLTFTIADLS